MTSGVFVGLSTIDIVYNVDEFPETNTKVAARSQDVLVGGPATNAAVTFAHLGGKPTLVTTVGRHALASVVRQELEKYSVRLIDLNPHFERVPALSSVVVDGLGNRSVVSANATRIAARPAEADKSVCEETRIVLVDGHYLQACQAWAAAARERRIPTVLDGGSWKDGTENLLRNIDTAICSANFLPPGCFSKDDVIQYLRDCGVAKIAITDGDGPIQYWSGQSAGGLGVPQVEAEDTMGAGDIFHGAYCFFSAAGLGFVESLAEAAKAASESCRYAGTREWMKHVPAGQRGTGAAGFDPGL
ncbi:MAG: PfkB family carbohydrate kinase [Terracidiphilus sp.]